MSLGPDQRWGTGMDRRLIGLVTLLLVAMPVRAQESDRVAQALALLDARLKRGVSQSGQAGLSITVVFDKDLIWTRSYGYVDLEQKIPATPQTLYRIGSTTKTFTALSILQLRDAGRLRLDDPLRLHVPATQIRLVDPDVADVTIRELLTHSAGLQREVPGMVWEPGGFPTRESLKEPLDQTFASSTRWKYSNLGYALLGEVVASASGVPWHQYVQEHILDPLGMVNTRPIPRLDEPGLAKGYLRSSPVSEYAPKVYGDFGALRAAGGMASTVEDLARYLRFHLGIDTNESVLSARTLREMHRPHWLLDDWQTAFGFGVGLRRFEGRLRVWFGGGVPGYRSQWEFIPSLRLGVSVLTNSEDGDPNGYSDYAIELLAPIVAKELAAPDPVPPADPKLYEGLYRRRGNRVRLITMLDGQLSAVDLDARNPYTGRFVLEPTTEPHAFIIRWPAVAAPDGETITFEFDSEGNATGFRHGLLRFLRVAE